MNKKNRDDFSEPTKKLVAQRVNFICSNPECYKPTSGPNEDPSKSTITGKASHITAASPGGPRYNPDLTPEERKHADNCIWLCAICADIIDKDKNNYPTEILKEWKIRAEACAKQGQINGLSSWRTPSTSFSALNSAIEFQFEQLSNHLSDFVAKELEEVRESLRLGERNKAEDWVKKIRNDSDHWAVLSRAVKAEVIRFQAVLELDNDNIKKAKSLSDEALEYEAENKQIRIRTLIACKEHGAAEALKIIDESSIDSINLKAGLLLENGDVEGAIRLLDEKAPKSISNAETYRIRSIAYIQKKDISQARLSIQKAVSLKPLWKNIKITNAIINYFSALNTCAIRGFSIWPEPINPVMVKTDNESLNFLMSAAISFKEIEEMSESIEERRNMVAWRFACLANDYTRPEEAETYCREAIDNDPLNCTLLIWALFRDYDIDLTNSKEALEDAIENENPDILRIQALTVLYLSLGKSKKAIKLLKKNKGLFERQGAEDTWVGWLGQSYIIDGSPSKAIKFIDKYKSGNKQFYSVKALALRAIAKKENDKQPLLEYLKTCFAETDDVSLLYEACQVAADLEDWEYISKVAQSLVARLENDESVRLAAIAYYNVGEYQTSLRLLESHAKRFLNGELPPQLQKLRVHCLERLGFLPQAISEAQAALDKDQCTENLLNLARLCYSAGDLKRLAVAARKIVDLNDVSPEPLLQIARLIAPEDPTLATSIWRKAVSADLSDVLVFTAVSIGYQLGLDSHMGHLIKRIHHLGAEQKGGIQTGTIEDLIKYQQQWDEHSSRLNSNYRAGLLPIHIIINLINTTLIDIYHVLPLENKLKGEIQRKPQLFFRHGGKNNPVRFGSPDDKNWRIYVDITAILLLEHLEMREYIEHNFFPLHIPGELIPALINMRDRVLPHQPSRERILQEISEIWDTKIHSASLLSAVEVPELRSIVHEVGESWVILYEEAKEKMGYLVDFLPIRKGLSSELVTFPEGIDNIIINCRSVVEALYQHGRFSAGAYKAALESLGAEGKQDPAKQIPELGSVLVCDGGILELFMRANILISICDTFKVYASQQELTRIQSELNASKHRRETAVWIGSLVDSLSSGIEKGIYHIMAKLNQNADIESEEKEDSFEIKCLHSLLTCPTRPGDIILSDDRFVNGYSNQGAASIADTYDLLTFLKENRILDDHRYYGCLTRLRLSNIYYLPLHTSELIYHLQQSRRDVENNSVIDTQELEIIRKYYANIFANSNNLQKPPVDKKTENPLGESAFVVRFGREIVQTIINIWSTNEIEIDICELYSNWIIDNLYIDHLGIINAAANPEKLDVNYVVAINLSSFLLLAISMPPTSKEQKISRRKKYFYWLWYRILEKRILVDPTILLAIGDIIKQNIRGIILDKDGEINSSVSKLLGYKYYNDLPELIREELRKDPAIMREMGYENVNIINLGEFEFKSSKFWSACEKAYNGEVSKLKTSDNGVEIDLYCSSNSGINKQICFMHPDKKNIININDDGLDILARSVTEREEFLLNRRHWFDKTGDQVRGIISEIASLNDPESRIEKIGLIRNESTQVFYDKLYQKLKEKSEFKLPDLLPKQIGPFLGRLGIDGQYCKTIEIREVLEKSCLALLQDMGTENTFYRICGLPVKLPDVFMSNVMELSEEDQRDFLRKLIRSNHSPVSYIHLAHILEKLSDRKKSYQRLSRRLVIKMFRPEFNVDLAAFIYMLRWISTHVARFNDFNNYSPEMKLIFIWSYTSTLYSIFGAAHVPPDWLRDFFGRDPGNINYEIFVRDANYHADVAHPSLLRAEDFLISGVFYCIGDKEADFSNAGVNGLIHDAVFTEVDGREYPRLPFFRDNVLTKDSLRSFLGGNVSGKLPPFMAEKAGQISTERLYENTESAIKKMEEGGRSNDLWLQIAAVTQGVPMYRELAPRFLDVCLTVDYPSLFEQDLSAGVLALQATTSQMRLYRDIKLSNHIEEQLIGILSHLEKGLIKFNIAEDDDTGTLPINESYILGIAFESALDISLVSEDQNSVVKRFSEVAEKIIDVYPSSRRLCRQIIQRICEELPISQVKELWKLLNYLRLA